MLLDTRVEEELPTFVLVLLVLLGATAEERLLLVTPPSRVRNEEPRVADVVAFPLERSEELREVATLPALDEDVVLLALPVLNEELRVAVVPFLNELLDELAFPVLKEELRVELLPETLEPSRVRSEDTRVELPPSEERNDE